jgi:hypothetical protein
MNQFNLIHQTYDNLNMIRNPNADNDARGHFYEQADRHIASLNIKFREKAVITRSTYEKLIACLQDDHSSRESDSRFPSWCRKTFAMRAIGTRHFLCDVKNGKPVLVYEDMYDVFKKIHIEAAHGGRDKCLDNLAVNYSWFNRSLLQIFLKSCSSCQKRKSILKPMLSKPIIALGEMNYFSFGLPLVEYRKMMKNNR